MAKENQVILNVGVDGAKTIADLRNNIKALKEGWEDAEGNINKGLNELEVGTKDYQDRLKELRENQNALKDAMYASSSSMENVAKSAKGMGTSYNALVHQMAMLKEEFRATEDAARRADIGKQILAINQSLKELDALQGNFQRNVGDYLSQAAVDMKAIVGDLPPTLNAIKGPLDGITKTTSLLGKQPIFGILALIAPILTKIVTELKANDTAVASLKKGLDALKPIADVFMSIVQKVADWLGVIIDQLVEYAPAVMGILKNIVTGATGVGNAVLQFIIAPVKAAIEAFKGLGTVVKDVFSGQFKQAASDAKNALAGINDIFNKGVSFRANFEAGQDMADNFLSGLSSPRTKKAAEDTGKEIGASVTKGVEEAWADWFDRLDKEATSRIDAIRSAREKLQAELEAETEADTQALADLINAEWEAEFEARERAMEEAEERRKNFITGMQSAVAATSDVLSSLADMMESGTNVTEKEARRAKNLRVASATIDMLQGATTAYSTAQSLGVPMGPIVGAINAAAVVAMGMANIAKIKSQNVSANASATGSVSPVVGTPSIAPQVSQVRTITSASEEDRLNQMASDQKVYLVTSELEAKQNDTRVRLAEATF